MPIYLTETLGLPIIIEPEAERDETSPQDHDRSRDRIRSVENSARPRSRSPFRHFHRHSNENPTLRSLTSQTLAAVQDPAEVGAPHEVKVIHDWTSDFIKVTKDMVKKMGHTESPPEPSVYNIVFEPGGVLLPARVELCHSRRNSILKITNLSTMKEAVGAALLPKSLAKHLRNSARLGLAPNTLHKTIYVDDKELELCELVSATCAFPDCPFFRPKRTYRWYWVVVNDGDNILEGRAFIPYNVGPREELTLLPTRSGIVPFPTSRDSKEDSKEIRIL